MQGRVDVAADRHGLEQPVVDAVVVGVDQLLFWLVVEVHDVDARVEGRGVKQAPAAVDVQVRDRARQRDAAEELAPAPPIG